MHTHPQPPTKLMIIILFVMLSIVMVTNIKAATITFSWLPNSESILKGYKLYYGTGSRNYQHTIDVGMGTTVDGRVRYTLQNPPSGKNYYAVTAYSDDLESDYSTEIEYTTPEDSLVTPTDFKVEIE